jgi:hypothetical protein
MNAVLFVIAKKSFFKIMKRTLNYRYGKIGALLLDIAPNHTVIKDARSWQVAELGVIITKIKIETLVHFFFLRMGETSDGRRFLFSLI